MYRRAKTVERRDTHRGLKQTVKQEKSGIDFNAEPTFVLFSSFFSSSALAVSIHLMQFAFLLENCLPFVADFFLLKTVRIFVPNFCCSKLFAFLYRMSAVQNC